MASNTTTADPGLPPDLFDQTTLVSLASTVLILAVAYGTSLKALSPSTPGSYRFLFIWHASIPYDDLTVGDLRSGRYYRTQTGYLGHDDRIWGSQAASADNPFAQLWMVYARADKRWAGADTGVVSLELLTVGIVAPLAVLVCYDIAKKNSRANLLMVIIATAELYGGFMTFCPEWLTGNQFLDGSNFMYLWVYLVFFNMLWVFIPFYAIYVSWNAVDAAFKTQTTVQVVKKSK
ncbi:hypothetical protein INS49_014824 [Diaporthe citri]|uniref:uncharacterized protein n=1 Tax=Diaporthe citri TaxID=83186 RepID=UPI001C818A45|nr:uncharacterized protein INS49_014824 [Diaporthe citri]KAG6356949.1 hypothetical protein INS49_014824 [Diaporthe citri]